MLIVATPIEDVYTISAASSFQKHEDRAYASGDCPQCGAHQFIVIAYTKTHGQAWLRCINCKIAVHSTAVSRRRRRNLSACRLGYRQTKASCGTKFVSV